MEFSSGQSFGTKSLFYLRLVLERTLPSGVIYLGELRPTWDHVHKSCILTLDKIGGEGGPAKNLHGVGRLVCPEGLAHRQNRIGLEASAGLMECRGRPGGRGSGQVTPTFPPGCTLVCGAFSCFCMEVEPRRERGDQLG